MAPINCAARVRYIDDHILSFPCIFNEGPSVLVDPVVAVDPDGERLKIAREKYSASNIEYTQADDKTFPPGQCDLIFSNIVIHWISDKKALFS